MLVSLVTVPLTFSYLGQERYGLWMVLLSIISSMGIADLGIGYGLMNSISEAYGKEDEALAREYVTSAFAMLLVIGAIMAVGGGVAYPLVSWGRVFNVRSTSVTVEGAHAFLVLYAWFVINIPLGVINRVQAGLQKGYLPQAIGMAGNAVTLTALLAVIHLHGSLAWLVFGANSGSVLSLLVNGWLLFREHPSLLPAREAYRASSAKKIFKLGMLFFLLQCAGVVGYTSDNIVITQVLGAAAVAAYAVPQKLFGIVTSVSGMALATLWPAYAEAIARGDIAWVRRVFFASLRATLIVTVSVSTLLVITGPWILRVFFGKALQASLPLLIVLAIWVVVNAVSGVIAVILNGASVLKVQSILSIATGAVNLALSIFFTRHFGTLGACLGSVVTTVLISFPVCAVLIRNLFRRLEKTKQQKCASGELAEVRES
jgi:O-antigen/teichoic acid export membrane protein